MRRRISIKGCVRPSARMSVCPWVRPLALREMRFIAYSAHLKSGIRPCCYTSQQKCEQKRDNDNFQTGTDTETNKQKLLKNRTKTKFWNVPIWNSPLFSRFFEGLSFPHIPTCFLILSHYVSISSYFHDQPVMTSYKFYPRTKTNEQTITI